MYPSFTKGSRAPLHYHVSFMPALLDSHPRLARTTLLQTIIAVAISILAPMVTHAGSATWDLNPTSSDWNTAANWTPMTVPNGPADIATFVLSNTTFVSISENTEVNGIICTPEATNPLGIGVPPNLTLTLSGTGITNNSGIPLFLRAAFSFSGDPGAIVFSNTATAANSTIDNHGSLSFTDSSNAGTAEIFNASGISFSGTSSASGANIHSLFGGIGFSDSSTAGHAVIAGGDQVGSISFADNSSAGSATIGYLGGGDIIFSDSSTGGTAQIRVVAEGSLSAFLSIGGHNPPGVTIGSLEGTGYVILGANNLTVGSNNLSTTFSGPIQEVCCNSISGLGGSLTKIGSGRLLLSGAATYTGDTNVNGGVLQVDGSTSSNTFINNKGDLAGGGTVNGNVTNYGGTVSPGDPLGVPGVLTVTGNYTQTPSAILSIQIAGADPNQVSVMNVLGIANLNGALDPELVNGFIPNVGQSFTIVNYTSLTGAFSHLKNQIFDHGRKRWALIYQPTSAVLVVENNGRRDFR